MVPQVHIQTVKGWRPQSPPGTKDRKALTALDSTLVNPTDPPLPKPQALLSPSCQALTLTFRFHLCTVQFQQNPAKPVQPGSPIPPI